MCANENTQLPSYYHCIGKTPLLYRTIGQRFSRAADKFGDNEAIVSCDEGKRLTYAQAQEKVQQITIMVVVLRRWIKFSRFFFWFDETGWSICGWTT